MRTPPAIAPVIALALALSSCAPAGNTPPQAEPSAEPANPVEAPEASEASEEDEAPEETEEPAELEETGTADAPQNVDDLPDIWPEISALWARQPSESRDTHCRNFEDEVTTEATVMLWQTLYSDATDEEADAEDVEVVLQWLCSDNT